MGAWKCGAAKSKVRAEWSDRQERSLARTLLRARLAMSSPCRAGMTGRELETIGRGRSPRPLLPSPPLSSSVLLSKDCGQSLAKPCLSAAVPVGCSIHIPLLLRLRCLFSEQASFVLIEAFSVLRWCHKGCRVRCHFGGDFERCR